MIRNEHATKDLILLPSWVGVRSIYKKLSDEFSVLTSAFHLTVPVERRMYLDHLIIAIDEIDTCIDELPTRTERDSISNSMIAFLESDAENWSHTSATPLLSGKIENLNKVVRQLDVRNEFVKAAKAIFSNTELKRHSLSVDELIDHVSLEGKATAILTLSVMGGDTNTPFGSFFSNLCMLMGIADLIVDARQDFKKGYIALKPSAKLYAKLFNIAIRDGISLLVHIPRKIRFAQYCLRMAVALVKA